MKIKLVLILLTAGIVASMTVYMTSTSQAGDCNNYRIEVENTSRASVKIVAVRWLDQPIGKWYDQKVENGVLAKNNSLNTQITMPNFENKETFLQVKYQHATGSDSTKWDEVQTTTDYHVAQCKSDGFTKMSIVDKRS